MIKRGTYYAAKYTSEFRRKLVRLHEEGCTYKSIIAEYGVSKTGIPKWCHELREGGSK